MINDMNPLNVLEQSNISAMNETNAPMNVTNDNFGSSNYEDGFDLEEKKDVHEKKLKPQQYVDEDTAADNEALAFME